MKINKLLTPALILAALSACTTMEHRQSNALNNDDLYEVHKDGRIYVFDDFATYRSFLRLGETPFTLVRIGAGPKGETLVFGLTAKDKHKHQDIASVDMYGGKLPASDNFYGEMIVDGRVYVFDSWEDMHIVRKTGEAPLRYTDIGGGPDGRTAIYVLNNKTKKQRPDALIRKSKHLHNNN